MENICDYTTKNKELVETELVFLEFFRKFLTFTFLTFVLTQMCPLLPQCWATHILEHWDDCNTQVNIGEGENHTSVSRFVTRIVDSCILQNDLEKLAQWEQMWNMKFYPDKCEFLPAGRKRQPIPHYYILHISRHFKVSTRYSFIRPQLELSYWKHYRESK